MAQDAGIDAQNAESSKAKSVRKSNHSTSKIAGYDAIRQSLELCVVDRRTMAAREFLLHDAGAMVVHRRRLAGMRRHQTRAHMIVEVLANLLVADLDARPEPNIDEAQQRQLPHRTGLQIQI